MTTPEPAKPVEVSDEVKVLPNSKPVEVKVVPNVAAPDCFWISTVTAGNKMLSPRDVQKQLAEFIQKEAVRGFRVTVFATNFLPNLDFVAWFYRTSL